VFSKNSITDYILVLVLRIYSFNNNMKTMSTSFSMMASCLALLVVSFPAQVFGIAPIIDMGTAGDYAILAAATITSTGVVGTVVEGNLGLSPGTSVTGFPPAIITGTSDVANAAAAAAKVDLTTAYNEAAAKPADTVLTGQGTT
jgi:hypothetical protein